MSGTIAARWQPRIREPRARALLQQAPTTARLHCLHRGSCSSCISSETTVQLPGQGWFGGRRPRSSGVRIATLQCVLAMCVGSTHACSSLPVSTRISMRPELMVTTPDTKQLLSIPWPVHVFTAVSGTDLASCRRCCELDPFFSCSSCAA